MTAVFVLSACMLLATLLSFMQFDRVAESLYLGAPEVWRSEGEPRGFFGCSSETGLVSLLGM